MVNHQIPMENIRLINLSFKTFAQKGRSSRAASMLQVNDACDLLLTCLMLAAFDWVLLLNVTEQNPQLLIIKGVFVCTAMLQECITNGLASRGWGARGQPACCSGQYLASRG